MQKILTKRERKILYLTTAVIIFAISFKFLILPVLTKNENLNKEIAITKTRLKKYLRLLSRKEYIQSQYNKFSTQLKGSDKKTDTLVNALAELENSAKTANIRIIEIRPQTPRGLALYKETSIDLRTEGEMDGYLKFIYNLENSLSLLRIGKFQLNAKPNTTNLEGIFSISQLSLD